MKRLTYIILFFALAMLTTCKKKPELKIYKLEVDNVEVNATSTSVKVSANYSYPTEIGKVWLLVSGESGMGDALESATVVEDNKLIGTVTGLLPSTKYYFCFRYNTGVNLENTEPGSFTTQSSGGGTGELAVTTLSVTSITTTTAVSGGNVTGDGGYEVTMRGVCWNTSGDPTVADNHTEDGTGTGVFLSNMLDLEAATEYHVRAYAINEMDTVYGDPLSFVTQSNIYGSVVTGAVSDITTNSAKASGEVTDDGGVSVYERGICWDTIANPTIANHKIKAGSGVGTFTCDITDLTLNTTYHVRAYATNTYGTNYGDDVEFITLGTIPVVAIGEVSDITNASAKVRGNVSNDWGSNVTERGICYSTSENPTTANHKVTAGTGLGDFECELADLAYNTKYYARAYAINAYGTNYSDTANFTTSDILQVFTVDVTDIGEISATFHGEVQLTGGQGYGVYRGFCWGTEPNPTYENSSHNSVGSGVGTYSKTVTGLTANTTYYVRAWGSESNNLTKRYGDEVAFYTGAAQLPTVTTTEVKNITNYSATFVGSATGSQLTQKGFCWSTSHNPTIEDNTTVVNTNSSTIKATVEYLTYNTTYYVRAYAINEIGIAYGEEIGFTTLPVDNQWIYYDNGVHTDNVGTGDSYSDERWGSMFPASMIGHYIGGRITKVALYESNNNVGSILLNIYIGGSDKPGTLVCTQSFDPESANAFHEIVLNTPVQITSAQNLWITFGQIGDPYPICACTQTGIPNNRWISSDGGNTWHDVATQGLNDSGWMIRGYLMFDDKEIMFGY